MRYKQVIVIRNDIGMSCGKMVAQACHASLGAYKKCKKISKEGWEESGARKIVLQADIKILEDIYKRCKSTGIPCYIVKDAGLTELKSGTITALGIGPCDEKKIEAYTSSLKTL